MPRRRAFTLIELMVVIGVIVLLLAILMPAIGKAREMANATKCAANVRTLTQAFLLFARDHDGHLPGTRRSWRAADLDGNPDHLDWLYGKYAAWDRYEGKTIYDRLQCAPQYGTLWKYVGNSSGWTGGGSEPYDVYRCPSMKEEKPGSGMGSNGRFDYAAFATFCGASIRNINAISQLHHPCLVQTATKDENGNVTTKLVQTLPGVVFDARDPMTVTYASYGFSSIVDNMPTPLVCQEEPAQSINYDPNDAFVHHDSEDDDWWGQMDGAHQRWDQMSHIHGGGSYYGAIDGSVVFVVEPDTDEAPGTWVSNGPGASNYDPNYPKSTGMYAEGATLWWQPGPRTHIPQPLDWDWGGYWTWDDPNTWKSGWNLWSSR